MANIGINFALVNGELAEGLGVGLVKEVTGSLDRLENWLIDRGLFGGDFFAVNADICHCEPGKQLMLCEGYEIFECASSRRSRLHVERSSIQELCLKRIKVEGLPHNVEAYELLRVF